MSFVASPSVRSYAGKHGVDLDQLARQTGRELIGREDVDNYLRGSGGTPAAAAANASHAQYWDVDHSEYGEVTAETMSRFAQVSAQNLAAANAMIPQVTHHEEADIGEIEAFRADLKSELVAKGVKLTTLAFHLKALAQSLKAFPRFNASLSSDGKTLYLKQYVHIGVAVDTPHGLMVPVIRDVDKKGLLQVGAEINDVAKRAQQRKVRLEEMGGASITISNLGGIGGVGFTPIVNPPQVAILGISRTTTKPKWDGKNWQPSQMVPLDLSYDHRVINGADAARFMVHFGALLETPKKLI
ncbi:2-oxo acid dehydrogenase subunit E2 [Maritalea mediterranea]|uniref:2-oxo acid dehydrogenase subunit E2 n=1 Tax=Maritalea mediterranea TaxID=2909667 RepID=A0ABS9E688_9HYPH|nr:2-oxo acid dehydrogenase subunit E2 [Maritalea mediterranea]MCF4098376.1 2-oxo acid dehydrogenase subunit E2 [Maritalea mediterranea]